MATQDSTFNDIDWTQQEREDELLFQKVLGDNQERGEDAGLFDTERPLDLGEKADDAEDFEDISDDDLPEEEDASGPREDVPGLTDDAGTSHDTDDLFGGRGSSPFGELEGDDLFHDNDDFQQPHVNGGLNLPSHEVEVDLREINFPEHYGTANQDPSIPAPAESTEDFLKQSWPAFEKGIILNWNELLPPKKAHYIPKVPVKPPKPIQPTKVSLDIALDQEKSFRATGPATSDKSKRIQEAEAKGLIPIIEESSDEDENDGAFDYDDPPAADMIGGVTMADLAIIVEDWESKINPEIQDANPQPVEEEPMDDWEQEILGHSAKKRKFSHVEPDYFSVPRFAVPNFDDFERMTAHLAKRVSLDLNDPFLLVDVREYSPAKRQRAANGLKRRSKGTFFGTLAQRFNISNDEAYDALKENHRSKVRATIGNIAVEHSLPAIKLAWPYYKVKITTRDARAWHRPDMKFKTFMHRPITFSRPGNRKRKQVKNMSIQDIYKESKDLSLSEINSSATLFEYSEEHPMVLSNFGMGNRVVNYYRRKNAEDTDRPQPEDRVGDVNVLLPEDKSPFANFGMVDPGETVRAIHNAMYRAPVFKHAVKNTDFLVIRSTTGINGTSWHIRNIDNLFVVGQQFPSMEIPGPHSRKVTNAAKNRMKMIAFRKIRHSPHHVLKIGDITAHIADSNDMQNRQKLKEFIQYDKAEKVWKMRDNDVIPDEATIRSMVKPEDVCLIDAMLVGSRQLEDAGYSVQDETGDDAAEGRSLEQNLTPWLTSKAFLEASAEKAMLQLHGDGDPSGCGLAFSFLRTSMKGGYLGALQGPSATSEAAMAAERKANGGHTYNVKKQAGLYNEAIRGIWEKQKKNLSDEIEHVENEIEREQAEEDERQAVVARTPYALITPAPTFDDSASQISRFSNSSRQGRVMRIIRSYKNKFGEVDEREEIIKDVRVWREYQKRRQGLDAESMNVYEAKPTGNAEFDRAEQIRIKKELARLERNQERRHAREKQKGIFRNKDSESALSPSSTPAPSIEKPVGTTRKCANCGQAGHIKTNKKLCPMLNGTMKLEDSAPNHGGFGAITAPSFI